MMSTSNSTTSGLMHRDVYESETSEKHVEDNGLMGRQNEGYDHTSSNSPTGELNGNVEIDVKFNHKSVNGLNPLIQENNEITLNESFEVYPIRWVVLVLFVLYSMSNAFQWIQYSIITNVITEYYGVGEAAVNWTSMVFMVAYIPLIFPASLLLDRRGLRCVVILGSFGTALGAWIKCASIEPDRFYVTMIGQSVAAISQIFVLNIPPRLASVFFGPKEISTACSIGVFGNQVGIALGFLLPPILVPSSGGVDAIGHGLTIMFYGVAAVTSALFVLILLVFKAEPPTCPSPAAASAKLHSSENENYLLSIYRLLKNRSYILLLISYGINTGVFYAVSTLLSQQFLLYFKDDNLNAGRVGLTIVLCGMAGSIICGIWLDRSHKFKETTLVVYILSLIGMLAYTFIFEVELIWTVYIIAGFLGFFMTGYLPVGFEFAAEITYPESEGTSAGLLNASAQVFGIACTIAGGALMNTNDKLSNLIMSGLLLIGVFMTGFVKSNLKRSAAQNKSKTVGLNEDEMTKEIAPCNVV
ncbi:hypothetical protein CHUAL_009104 [Chamberlinius hualienensis]